MYRLIALLAMAETTNNTASSNKVVSSCTLREFRSRYEKMKVAPFVNSQTGEEFHSCAFLDKANKVTLVGFSSNLGELTAPEIKDRVDSLRVVELTSGSYKLCEGKEDFSNWIDVDI